MIVVVKDDNIERAIATLSKWYEKNLKLELRTRSYFESNGEKRKGKWRQNKRRAKRRMARFEEMR